MSLLDFSGEEQGRSFDLIPDKTVCHVVLNVEPGDTSTPEGAYKQTSTGLLMLRVCATVTEGEFRGRKIWQNFNLSAVRGATPTEGQQKSINIARSMLRQILEAGRGVESTDESPAAATARTMQSVFELDGLEMWVTVGIDKARDAQYQDQNKIAKVHPFKRGAQAAASPAGSGGYQVPPAAAPRPSSGAQAAPKKPSWA